MNHILDEVIKMYTLVITITFAIVFLLGWNAANLYREYEQKQIEEKEQIVKMYRSSEGIVYE